MFLRLLILFIVVPLTELWLLEYLSSGSTWNFLATIALVIGTGVLGAWLAKRQGLQVWRRIYEQISQGHAPAAELLDGVMILLAGAVLITPGLLTDIVGLLLLVPRIRLHVGRWLVAWFKKRTIVRFQATARTTTSGPATPRAGTPGPTIPSADETVIDAEFTRREDR